MTGIRHQHYKLIQRISNRALVAHAVPASLAERRVVRLEFAGQRVTT